MDSLKGLLSDNKRPSVKQQKRKSLPLIGPLDYCYRFRPLADRSTFEQELDHTEGEVVEYFPKEISEQYRGFLRATRYMTIGFWVISLSFAGFCHKIGFISRLMGDRTWKMFGFKLSTLVLPYLVMDSIMPTAESEQLNFLWESMNESYKRYKYTGDILQLNRSTTLVGEGLPLAAVKID